MNNKAYINKNEVSLSFAGLYHDMNSKLKLGVGLNKNEAYLYLLLKQKEGKIFRNENNK